jgi:PIN domain nuclease of toxin-antitoxin system
VGPVVLDASPLVAALTDEPAMGEVEELLRRRPPPSISATNLAEAIDQLVRVQGAGRDETRRQVNLLIAGGLEVEPVWLSTVRLAASLRADHYHRTRAPVSLSDCICLATAMRLTAALATTDPALASVARTAGVEVIALPNAHGQRP